MKYTLTIKNLDKHTLALLNLIKATKNVGLKEQKEDFSLSDTQKEIIDQRIEKHNSGESKSFSWEEVKKKARSAK